MDTELAELSPSALAEVLRDHPARVEIPPEHHFAPGLYARKVTLPAGTFAIGEKHKTTHISVLAKGTLLVRGVAGMPDHRMQAGDVMTTPAGSQRTVYAETECVFVCIHFNPENVTDMDTLRAMFVELPALEQERVP